MTAPAAPVVTGLGVLCPIGQDVRSFAEGLRAGHSAIAEQPGERDGPRFAARLAGFTLDAVLPAAPDLPVALRRSALRLGGGAPRPTQAGVAVAAQAWTSARLHEDTVAPERVALVVAAHTGGGRLTGDTHARYAADPTHVPPRFALRMLATEQVGTVSEVLGITGEGITVDAASASGNAAVIAAARIVAAGDADVCLVLGSLTEPSTVESRALGNLGAMAWDTRSVPFDESHTGFVPGEGAACLVLESPESARSRAVPALARLAGYAYRLDASRLAEPNEHGERAVMSAALARAGRTPRDVGYLNAHGSGAPRGDRTEVAAIQSVLSRHTWINSTKSLVGHCFAAAGVIEAVATVIQMAGGFVHANAGLRVPVTSACRFVGRRAEPARVRTALSNGFAFGGVNTCVALSAGDEEG